MTQQQAQILITLVWIMLMVLVPWIFIPAFILIRVFIHFCDRSCDKVAAQFEEERR